MTTDEAKELYLKSDCSYFIMCTYHYSSYMEYRQLGLPKEQEDLWKNEKLRMLKVQMQKTGDYKIFGRLYDIAVTFRDYPRLFMMWDAFKQITAIGYPSTHSCCRNGIRKEVFESQERIDLLGI